ncbi:S-layer homology domain-containing protein [Domibacillus sp. DTU_2020_1001157_1_SI_ALB_TIR_016]|uniref:S-layer homology domain-containing protein n=1 Tax=Domibacillus sp. DTU_2020_1001157_1_SI_ALB_TIR_016 TaxID=3077789 RepID=UPI0028E85E03|nr:S-layer homology domain-containing protein [Domibacillus sp. DTU_2020_1001157_1_SI_ALB_TIR_016]WNS82276.1 S-layer homology domain-containing protein [Domibacillus sp. DTU_2020_1001157_1_SI_ALB_TIR_016]
MNKYTLFTAATAATVAISSISVPANAEELELAHPFTDVGSRYDDAVSFLYLNEMINGVSATKFGTTQTLTRGDAAVILAKMLELDTANAKDAGFKDLNSRIRGSVNALAEIGVVSGVTSTEFKPELPLSRGAMAKFIVTAFELEEYAKSTPFTDVGGVFKSYIESLYGTEITSGKTATSFGTNSNITRGEFAILLWNTFLFSLENGYYPTASGAQVATEHRTKVFLSEPVPEEYTAEEVVNAFIFSVEFSDGTFKEIEPTSYFITQDRKTLFVTHSSVPLTGKKGNVIVGDIESQFNAPFDFTATKTTSSANVKSTFEHTNVLPATTATE